MIEIIRNTNNRNQMKAPRASVGISSSYLQQIPVVEVASNGEIQPRRRITSCSNIASSFQGQPQTILQNHILPPYIPNKNTRSSSSLSSFYGFSRTDSTNLQITQPSPLSPQRRLRTSSIETSVLPQNVIPSQSQQQLFDHKTADKIKGQQLLYVLNFPVFPHCNSEATFQYIERRSSNGINSHQEISQQGSRNFFNPQKRQQPQFHCNSESNQDSQQQQMFQQQEQMQSQIANMKTIICSSAKQVQQNQAKGQFYRNRVIMEKQVNQPQSESGIQLKQQIQPQQQYQQLLELQSKQRIGQIPEKQSQIEQQQQQLSFYQHQKASSTPILRPITNQINSKDTRISQTKQLIMNCSKADELYPENQSVKNDWRQNYPTQKNYLNSRTGHEQEQLSYQKDITNIIAEDKQEQQYQQLEFASKHQLERISQQVQESKFEQAEIHQELLGDYSFSNTKQADQYKEILSGSRNQKEKLLIPGQNKKSIEEGHDYLKYLNKVNHPEELVQQYKTSEGKTNYLLNELEKCKQDIVIARIEGEMQERKSLEVEAMKNKLRLEHERLKEDYAILKEYNQRLQQQNEQFKGQFKKQGMISGIVWPVQQSQQKYDLNHKEMIGTTNKGKLNNCSEREWTLVENHQKCESDKVDTILREEKQPEKENDHMEIGNNNNNNNKIVQPVSYLDQQESSRQLVADFQDISLLKEFYPENSQRSLPPLPNYCSISSCSDSSDNNLHKINCNNCKLLTSPSAIFRIEGDSRYSTLFSQLNDSQFSMPLTPSVNLPMIKYDK